MDTRNAANVGDKPTKDNPLLSLAEMSVSTANERRHTDGAIETASPAGERQETELLDLEAAIARGLISADFWTEQPMDQE